MISPQNLPTDNLYKFIAVFGLVLFVFVTYTGLHYMKSAADYSVEIKAESIIIERRIAMLERRKMAFVEKLDKLRENDGNIEDDFLYDENYLKNEIRELDALLADLSIGTANLFAMQAKSKHNIAVMKLGMAHPMGPLQLADFIGLDVCLSILRVMHEGFGNPKYAPCPLLVNMVTAGKLGAKSGEGFYSYTPGSKDLVVSENFRK